MTILEQYTYESVKHAASVVAEELPKITKALLAIAQELHEANGQYPDVNQSAMGPGDDEDLPF
jgi:hypothetical protein